MLHALCVEGMHNSWTCSRVAYMFRPSPSPTFCVLMPNSLYLQPHPLYPGAGCRCQGSSKWLYHEAQGWWQDLQRVCSQVSGACIQMHNHVLAALRGLCVQCINQHPHQFIAARYLCTSTKFMGMQLVTSHGLNRTWYSAKTTQMLTFSLLCAATLASA